ncbi:uncharacterized protein (TIRG00374 family) [Methanomicrobium sp. W14]|uniref:lysylphosphatidylglycerol synthase transmembrane domain-containing protein n=1 Tax=Methanomicrobium sp. W14 TaxID=2817839 RepID=UPI001AEB96A9|nr:lysylphosphatidylglycerol synthase transmembrane domain-containing protein [Methanomicrobium sp. W14]MBP2134355.1 uncharacterized protein (TIRG00374 family) [Methanomicrobium sp. W14]
MPIKENEYLYILGIKKIMRIYGKNKKKDKLLQQILLLIGLLILIYFIYSSGVLEDLSVFSQMNLYLYLFAILLSLVSVAVKIYRWKYLSHLFGTEMSWRMSSIVTLSGLFFCNITPGKVGDLYKAYFMKKKYSLGYANGVSMIFYERFFELFILIAIAFCSIFVLRVENTTILMITLFIVFLLLLLFIFWKIDYFINISKKYLVKVPFVNLDLNGDINIRKIGVTKSVSVFLITSVSLFAEFCRLWIVALAFGVNLNFITLSVSFCLSIIIGLLSQIPLGIGFMEGSLSLMIGEMGVVSTTAIAIVMADRVISMYLVLVIGLLVSKISFKELNDVMVE